MTPKGTTKVLLDRAGDKAKPQAEPAYAASGKHHPPER